MSTSYPLHKIKVVLLEQIHPQAVHVFESAGFQVELHDRAYQGEELLSIAGDAHILGIRSKTKLTASFFENSKKLLGVGCFCIGTNQVDLTAAARAGVPVFNEAFSNTRSVAELVIAEIISLHRKLTERSALMHQGEWRKSAQGAHEIRGRTLGVVGYGRIGSQVSVLAEAMGMRVHFYDISSVLPLGNALRCDSLSALLAESDVVTLHVPSTPETKGMIGREEIAQMKRGSYLLNNARGDVVEISALVEALENGHLAGAAVDVFPKEPASNADRFTSPLQGLSNVILTPHIGGSTLEAQRAIADSVSQRLTKYMNNGTTASAVNLPQVQLPRLHKDHSRVLHYHKNVPGVLRQIHNITGELNVNISAEYLQTEGEYAYMIIDLAQGHDQQLRDQLLKIPETIRIRTLW